MKKNFNFLLAFCFFACTLCYVSCVDLNDTTTSTPSGDYDLSIKAERVSYLNEIKNTLNSEFDWQVQNTVENRKHHCPPETSSNGECETFTGPVPIYLSEEFCALYGIPYSPSCYVTGNIEATFCITQFGVEVSWKYKWGSILWSNCPELNVYLNSLPSAQRWEIIHAIFDYGKANYETGFFDQWVGLQPVSFDCNGKFSYVLDADSWSAKCEGRCIFWNQETNEIESKQVACGAGCCATATTWCWDSELGKVVSTPGVTLTVDGECTFTPNKTCNGWLISCEESEACH